MAKPRYQLNVFNSTKVYGHKVPGPKFSSSGYGDTPQKVEVYGKPWDFDFYKKNTSSVYITKYNFNLIREVRSIRVNNLIKENLENALSEVTEYCKKSGYEIRSIGGYLFRLKKNTRNFQTYGFNLAFRTKVFNWYKVNNRKIPSVKRWDAHWSEWAAHYFRDSRQMENETGFKRSSGPIITYDLLSNHSFGTAIDFNPTENDMYAKKWDMPIEIVHIMRSYGFDWGGYFKDPMHFEYLKKDPPRSSSAYYPSQQSNNPEPPAVYYEANEKQKGGYYPLSMFRGLHAGVHLPIKQPYPAPVKNSLPGYIVAARMVSSLNNDFTKNFIGDRPLGFVLIRHEFNRVKNGEIDADDPIILYSLYMHLSAPNWNNPGDFEAKIPWLKRFFQMQYGGVVDLDVSSKTFGQNLWASAAFNQKSASIKVSSGQIATVKNGTPNAVGKPSPEDAQEAIKGFKNGSVVSFDRALLPVKAGETIGLCEKGLGKNQPFFHWEILSRSDDSGIKKIIELDTDIKALFNKPHKETKTNNFYELDEFKKIVDMLPDAEKKLLQPAVVAIEKEKKNKVSASVEFSKNINDFFEKHHWNLNSSLDDAKSLGQFTYPLKLNIENSYNYAPKSTKIEIEFLSSVSPKKVIISTAELTITDFTKKEYTIQVPGGTSIILFTAKDCVLVERNVSDKGDAREKRLKKEFIDLMKPFIESKFRGVVVDHVSEWTPAGQNALLNTLEEKGYLKNFKKQMKTQLKKQTVTLRDIKKQLEPLAWWGKKASGNNGGEIPFLGKESTEKSIFDKLLPADGKVQNLHPVTMLSLVEYFWRTQSILPVVKWPFVTLKRDESTKKPPYFGVHFTGGQALLGGTAYMVSVQHGYGSGEEVKFIIQKGGSKVELGKAKYLDGVAVLKDRFEFWGNCEVLPMEGKYKLTPSQLFSNKLNISKPEPLNDDIKWSKKKPQFIGVVSFKKHLPESLAGFVYFKYWKREKEKKMDASTPSGIGQFVLPVIAIKNKALPSALQIKLDLHDALGELVYQLKPKSNEVIDVAAGFLSPNGGHFDFDENHDPQIEDDDPVPLQQSLADIKSNAKDDFLDWPAKKILATLAPFGFSDLSIRMSKSSITFNLLLTGDTKTWKNTRPVFWVAWGKYKKYKGIINGSMLKFALPLNIKRKSTVWGEKVDIDVEVKHPSVINYEPKFTKVSLEIKPAIKSFFASVSKDTVNIVGEGKYIPTDIDFVIKCEKLSASDWLPDNAMQKNFSQYVRCDASGMFTVSIPTTEFADKTKRRFTWLRTFTDGNIYGIPFVSRSFEFSL